MNALPVLAYCCPSLSLAFFTANPRSCPNPKVAFNIYGPCLGLRSFPYTEEQYLEKLGITIAMLNDFDQARSPLLLLSLSPLRSKSLPARTTCPRHGNLFASVAVRRLGT